MAFDGDTTRAGDGAVLTNDGLASDGQYQALFDAMLDGFAHCRMIFENGQPRDFLYLKVNRAFAAITGLTDVVGRTVTDVIPGIRESNPELFEIYGRVASTGRPERFETCVRALDVWFDISVYSPESGHFVAVFADITARKRAEAALRESEERFRSFFDNAPIGKSITALDGGLLRVNAAFCAMLGYTMAEMHDLSFGAITHPDDVDKSRECARALLAGETRCCEMDKRYVRKDGRTVWAHVVTRLEADANGKRPHFLTHVQDISPRKDAEDALRASEERVCRLLENLPDVVYRYRLLPELKCEYMSPAVTALTGYTPEDYYADPWLVLRTIHAEDRPVLDAALRGDVPAGAVCVARWVHKDGRVIWTEHRPVTIRDEAGRPASLEGVSRDITQRIQAQAEIDLRTRALEAAANAVVITDIKGCILWVNPAFTSLTGYAAAEVIGRNPRMLSSGTHSPAFYESLWQTIGSGQIWTGEIVNRRKDGTLYTEEMTITPVRSEAGAVTHFVAIKQDVTERREMDAARRESDQRFREIAENIHEVFWITDPDLRRMIYISPAYEEVWGRSCASLYDDPVSFVEAIVPEDRKRVLAALGRLAERGFDEVYVIARPDGSQRWIHARGFPVRGPEGDVVRVVGSAQDITELKEAEHQLRMQTEILQTVVDNVPIAVNFFDASGGLRFANREWERLLGWTVAEAKEIDVAAVCYPDPVDRAGVREHMRASAGLWKDFRMRVRDGRTLDTAWANVRLSDGTIVGVGQDMSERRRLESEYRQAQKMEAIGRLAGGVAHDFNNLLGVITGYSEMALRRLEGNEPVQGRIEQVLKAASRAADLTRQLLAFSRRQVLEPKIVDLNALVADLGKMLSRLVGEDVEMVFRSGAVPEAVRVDPGQMEQVVMNLVVNARDAMPRGGTLTLETANVDLEAPLMATPAPVPVGTYAVLSVADTGHGIDAAHLAQIFEPFFTTKPLGEGTGLGLSTVYGIVKQSGGHITVCSEPGQGTTFRIYLPLIVDESFVAAPRPAAEYVTGNETILLVEDQETLREVVQETLQDLGYTLLVAEGADAALALAAAHEGPIHLLLSDVVMPRVSGPELATRLASLRPEVKVLFMSGYTNDVLGRTGAGLHAAPLLDKPFTCDGLARKVRYALDRSDTDSPRS
jgi:two-component system, cell cycle sensor histidine kinase and response regulator CckA